MKKFEVVVHVFIKREVVNPEEKPTSQALNKLGFRQVTSIRMGRCFVVSLESSDAEQAKTEVKAMCEKLLVNHVTENFEIIGATEVIS